MILNKNQIDSVIFFLQNLKKLFSIILKSTILHFRELF